METIFPNIQSVQFSIFLTAINHIAAKKTPVVNVSKKGVAILNCSKFPEDKFETGKIYTFNKV